MSLHGQSSGVELGNIRLDIGPKDSAMPLEFWAQEATKRIITVGNKHIGPIRDQAVAFQNQIYAVILHEIQNAVSDRRARDALIAERKDPEIAAQIRED